MKRVVDTIDDLNLKYNPPMMLNSEENTMEKSFGVFDKVCIAKEEQISCMYGWPQASEIRLSR
ncbi:MULTISPECIES: hypothetical protein [unclassified Selenomonas]|uniref:hypothetical protein n=1 Tax=unclassified Selenomonas TaxID=2637378 RepID=UPI0004956528